jgi:hypothetical protein
MKKDILCLPAKAFHKNIAPYSLILANTNYKDFLNLADSIDIGFTGLSFYDRDDDYFLHISRYSCISERIRFMFSKTLTINCDNGKWKWRLPYIPWTYPK